MDNKKNFELTTETRKMFGRTLFRIKALKSFNDVKVGDLGGFIEKEENLSENAWVCDDACVCGNARVYGDARICGNARVFENARICGDARVYENACIYGNAWVYGDARIYGDARVYGDASVFENARIYDEACVYGSVYDDARVFGNARVYDDARVYGNAHVYENACVYGNARVYGNTWVYGNAWVCDDARVYGNARVYGVVKIYDAADLSNNNDYIYFKCLGSSLTFFKCKDGHIHVSWNDDTTTFIDDSFDRSLYAFEKEVKKLQNNKYDEYAKGYLPCIEIVKIHFGLTDDEV